MELSRTDRTLLHLVLISGVGPAMVERLLRSLTSDDFDQLYQCTVSDLMRWGIPERTAQVIVHGLADQKVLEAELGRLEKYRIQFITAFHEKYPSLLKHTHLPPLGLYVQGEIQHEYARSLAIVGSRQANSYGQQITERIVPDLVAEDWLLVSGGALGADTLVHAATLRARGKTVAVIGSGLLNQYPATNRRLFQYISAQGGAVVSPFPLLMQGFPTNFPARNRIIAGMTRGCLVVQAAAKSGALITADYALKEGREVFAVPGSVFDPLSAGCHELLRQGAGLVQEADDILQVYGFARATQVSVQLQIDAVETRVTAPAVIASNLSPLLAFCATPRTLDELVAFNRSSLQELYDTLWEHQVAGSLEENSAGKWQLCKR
jgi:DNA processing protein